MDAYLGSFPDVLGVLRILLNDRQDTGGDNTVSLAKVVVDFCIQQLETLHVRSTAAHELLPCRVRVMDCSSFSNSSVRVRLRVADGPLLDAAMADTIDADSASLQTHNSRAIGTRWLRAVRRQPQSAYLCQAPYLSLSGKPSFLILDLPPPHQLPRITPKMRCISPVGPSVDEDQLLSEGSFRTPDLLAVTARGLYMRKLFMRDGTQKQ